MGNGPGIKHKGPTLPRVLVAVSIWAASGAHQSQLSLASLMHLFSP